MVFFIESSKLLFVFVIVFQGFAPNTHSELFNTSTALIEYKTTPPTIRLTGNCTYEGSVYQVGEFTSPDCTARCTCNLNGFVSCASLCPPQAMDCGENEELVQLQRKLPSGNCTCPCWKCIKNGTEVAEICPKQSFGTPEASGVYLWAETKVGGKATITCPYDRGVFVSRSCYYTENCEIEWGTFDVSHCKSRNKRSQDIFLLSMKPLDADNVLNVSYQTKNLSFPGTSLTTGDIINLATIIENIGSIKTKVDQVADNFLATIDNVLDARLENVLSSQIQSNSSARIVQALNNLLETLSTTQNKSFQAILRNFVCDASLVDSRSFSGMTFSGILNGSVSALSTGNIVKNLSDKQVVTSPYATTIRLPRSIFNESMKNNVSPQQRVVLALYKETKFFQVVSSNAHSFKTLNSYVIAGSIPSLSISQLDNPVMFTFRNLTPGDTNSTLCSFWDLSQGNWSQEGCLFLGVLPDGRIKCSCDHLTNFAILMDINPHEEVAHVNVLGIISYIGCAISLLGLVLTILTVSSLKELRTKVPSQILLNFCIALSLTLVVFLAAAERSKTSSKTGCRIAAIALHYFVLATFMWMAIEAFNMYMAFVKVLPSYFPKFMLKCCIAAWGTPALIVIITVGVAHDDYGDNKYCRLYGVPFLASFLVPALVILFGNIITFILIFRSLLTSGKKVTSDRQTTGLQRARQGIAISILLGLTWIFGIFAIQDAKLVFQYLFCIFNSLQGFFVFLFYCVLPPATRKLYRNLWKKKTRKKRGHHNVVVGTPKIICSSEGITLETFSKKENSESRYLAPRPEGNRTTAFENGGLGIENFITDKVKSKSKCINSDRDHGSPKETRPQIEPQLIENDKPDGTTFPDNKRPIVCSDIVIDLVNPMGTTEGIDNKPRARYVSTLEIMVNNKV